MAHELRELESVDIAAAKIAPSRIPRTPTGISSRMKRAKTRSAALEDEIGCGDLVEAVEPDADQKEQGELGDHDESANPQGALRVPQLAGAQIALDHHLVDAVRAEGDEGAADQTGPERVRLAPVEAQVEDPELVGGLPHIDQLSPAAGELAQQQTRRR